MNILIAALFACGCVSMIDAPMWPSSSDYVDAAVPCSRSGDATACETTRTNWNADFNAATTGQYQAQKTVARCLSTGCDGAIRIDRVLGCAWSRVAQAQTKDGGTDSDLALYCGTPYLDEAGARAAKADADAFEQMLSVK